MAAVLWEPLAPVGSRVHPAGRKAAAQSCDAERLCGLPPWERASSGLGGRALSPAGVT